MLPDSHARLSLEQTIAELSREHERIPTDALESADAHRAALVQPLIDVIDRAVTAGDFASDGDASLFSYALYLLAKWREPRAYSAIVRWLSMRGEGASELGGDIVTNDGGCMLASVCDGDIAPIKALALNHEANEYCRAEAITALGLLAAWAELPREPIVDCLLWLAREGLERERSFVWAGVHRDGYRGHPRFRGDSSRVG